MAAMDVDTQQKPPRFQVRKVGREECVLCGAAHLFFTHAVERRLSVELGHCGRQCGCFFQTIMMLVDVLSWL